MEVPVKKLVLLTLTLSALAQANQEAIDKFFDHLSRTTGDYHQATIVLQSEPSSDPKDMDMHEKANTLSSRRLSKDKYVLQTFTKGEKDNEVSADVIERKDGQVVITHHDLTTAADSYRVVATLGGETTNELSFYRSEVVFLENDAAAKALRKAKSEQRQRGMAGLVLALTLLGERVPAEVIQNEEWREGIAVNTAPHLPFIFTQNLMDPKGKSERRPKGEPSLNIIQVFHAGE